MQDKDIPHIWVLVGPFLMVQPKNNYLFFLVNAKLIGLLGYFLGFKVKETCWHGTYQSLWQEGMQVNVGCSVVSDSVILWTLPMGFSRQEYFTGLPFPSPGIFLTQGSNPGLLHCRQILYHLSHQGSPDAKFLTSKCLLPKRYLLQQKLCELVI